MSNNQAAAHGSIRLHPVPDTRFDCPRCQLPLTPYDWYMPGMRMLAALRCGNCLRQYYGDLPAGGGVYYPMLLDQETGSVQDSHGVPWFADWLAKSYAQRSSEPLRLEIESFRSVCRPILLNCLDTLYGHSLLKLLNAQLHIDQTPEHDLVALVPRFLRWMVPEGVAEVWSVDWPLRSGTQWNDRLACDIHNRLSTFGECRLSAAPSHPDPASFNIERFTGVEPFDLSSWTHQIDRPTVTFIWRDDRPWIDDPGGNSQREQQSRRIVSLANRLKAKWPIIDFGVAGLSESGGLPEWIGDLRRTQLDIECEKIWCRRYAASHVVIGVHGSNMLLPSAHAGSVVDLMPPDRWRNVTQDILFRSEDGRDMVFRHRFIPIATPIEEAGNIIESLLLEMGHARHKHTSAARLMRRR
jgi:hypothetical protein